MHELILKFYTYIVVCLKFTWTTHIVAYWYSKKHLFHIQYIRAESDNGKIRFTIKTRDIYYSFLPNYIIQKHSDHKNIAVLFVF